MTLKDGLRMQKQRQKCMRAHADVAKKYLSAVPFHPSERPLLSAPWCSQMPVTSPWKDKREGEPDTDSPSPPTPQWRASRIERCSWSLRSAAGLISPSYPLLVPPGSMRLETDVSVISLHHLVREGSSSLMHYSHRSYLNRAMAQWLNKNEKAYNSCSFTLLWLILYGDVVVTIMWHVIVCPRLEWS